MTKAKIGKEIITLEEVEQAQLEQQREALLSQQIERLIAKRLLASCARRHGLTVEALLEVEVQGKAAEVMEAEITTFIDQNRARLRGEEAKLRPQIRHHLRTQKIAQQWQAYVQALRARANVTVDQEEMKTTRVWASPDKGVARGLATAPVTIVEFADFQCPFGKSVLPTIKQVMDRYPGRVR